ncbi:MAG: helix-turn-helix domain-containing protein [Rubricoccaceae bacterium]
MVTLDQGGRGCSSLHLVGPSPALRAVVEHVWVQRYPKASPDAEPWRIVADDAPHLIGQSTPTGARLVLVGARTTYVDADVSNRRFTVGVRLQPGTLPALFGVSANELTDRSATLADVLGRDPAEAYDALATEDAHAAIRSLAAFLADRTRVSRPVDDRMAALVRAGEESPATIRHAAEALDLSDRTVRYWSRQHVGMGMKRLWRIRGLHRALQLGLQQPEIGWSRIAIDAGYADQSHLVRDCRSFLGEPPTAFLARAHA